MAAEAILVSELGQGSRFAPPEKLKGFSSFASFLLEIQETAINAIEVGKKVTGMMKIVDKTGDIKYELIKEDQTEKEKQGLVFLCENLVR